MSDHDPIKEPLNRQPDELPQFSSAIENALEWFEKLAKDYTGFGCTSAQMQPQILRGYISKARRPTDTDEGLNLLNRGLKYIHEATPCDMPWSPEEIAKMRSSLIKREASQPDEITIIEHIWRLFDQFQSPTIGNRSPHAEASARRKAKEVYEKMLPFLRATERESSNQELLDTLSAKIAGVMLAIADGAPQIATQRAEDALDIIYTASLTKHTDIEGGAS